MDWLAVGGRCVSCCPCRPVPSVCLIIGSPPLPCLVSSAIDFVPVSLRLIIGCPSPIRSRASSLVPSRRAVSSIRRAGRDWDGLPNVCR